jgi:hypothetical protein
MPRRHTILSTLSSNYQTCSKLDCQTELSIIFSTGKVVRLSVLSVRDCCVSALGGLVIGSSVCGCVSTDIS